MKGIILAGGAGSRLYPLTDQINKHFLPVFDKPMIYYPLSTLMLAGVKEILIISSPNHCGQFEEFLGDGSQLGIKLSYAVQSKPRGLADAFIVGREFVQGGPVTLILGDNIFYGDDLPATLRDAIVQNLGATIFAYHVANPSQFGIVDFSSDGRVISIEEKPETPKSSWAVPGIYVYDQQVSDIACKVQPSARGEIEITSINNAYLDKGQLHVRRLGRGTAWLDTGTPSDLQEAGQFLATVERRQGLHVGCIEEVALMMGYIDASQFKTVISKMPNSPYATYLRSRLDEMEDKS
jgi:glucose-1-phosphate thymidylyltransferase